MTREDLMAAADRFASGTLSTEGARELVCDLAAALRAASCMLDRQGDRIAELETAARTAMDAYAYAYRQWDADKCESAKYANTLSAIAAPLRAALKLKLEVKP